RELTRAIRCRSTPLPSLLSAPHTRTMHTLCLRVALPIFDDPDGVAVVAEVATAEGWSFAGHALGAPLEHFASLDGPAQDAFLGRSEEHTSELQSREKLVCRLLLEKKQTHPQSHNIPLSPT